MYSTQYKYWHSVVDFRRCPRCEEKHGKIYLSHELIAAPRLSAIDVGAAYSVYRQNRQAQQQSRASAAQTGG